MRIRLDVVICCFSFWLLGCVSNSKFETLEVEKNKLDQQNIILQKEVATASQRIEELESKVDNQRDDMIKQNMLSNELITEKINLENTIKELDKRIGSVTSEARSSEQTLNNQLQSEIERLKLKENQLLSIQTFYQTVQTAFQTLSNELEEVTKEVGNKNIELELEQGRISIILFNTFLFGKNLFIISNTAKSYLNSFSSMVQNYPEMMVDVQGHHDNTNLPSSKYYKDVLELTALRATSIVRYLTKETNMSGNQITASGKSGFFPRVSNETAAGRNYNQRVELVIVPDMRPLLKLIR